MHHPSLEVSLETVARACRVARRVQQQLERVRKLTKDDRSPVTIADFAVQAIVSLALGDADPEMRLAAEEGAELLRRDDHRVVLREVVEAVQGDCPGATAGDVLAAIDRGGHDGSADGYWVLDPIDGTKGFLRGQQYAIALARIERGQVVLGVMGCPNLPLEQDRPLDRADGTGAIYAAVRGQGAVEIPAADPRRRQRSIRTARVGAAPIRICESVEAAHSNQSDSARIVEAMGGTSSPVRVDSQCKYALVARGQADAYLRLPAAKGYVEKIWDHAAGSLLASEAGATVSDITGTPLDFGHGRRLERNRGVICAGSEIHGRLIEVIRELGITNPA